MWNRLHATECEYGLLCAASIEVLWKHGLLSVYLDDELILIDLPILCGLHGPHVVQLVSAQLTPESFPVQLKYLATETRPVHNRNCVHV